MRGPGPGCAEDAPVADPATPRNGHTAAFTLPGVTVLERGWLSSNNIVLHGADGEGATLVDSGHCVHAAQTVGLVRHALRGEPLSRVVNTHLHSDHCGGNAALQREFGCEVFTPPGLWPQVLAWDEVALGYAPARHRCERFHPKGTLSPSQTLDVGRRRWQALAAPGHDPHSLILFEPEAGVLISADALWENGFGVVFPELDGIDAFDEVAASLDLIESLPVRWVIPGHGAPFGDVQAALRRSRSRLAEFKADPARHLRHAAKVMLKYHLLEELQMPLAELPGWLLDTPLLHNIWAELGRPLGAVDVWGLALVDELVAKRVLVVRGDTLHND